MGRDIELKYLRSAEKIGIVATGFAVRKSRLLKGISYLKSKGFVVETGKSIFRRSGYFSGTERERAQDLNHMIRRPEIRCIIFARGGFGTSKILPRIDFQLLRNDPKILLGYSDVTSLFLAAARKMRLPALYGPVAAELGCPELFDEGSLWSALSGKDYRIRFARQSVIRDGMAEGELQGGCLTLISTLIGTQYEPDFRGKILFWEEVNEELYRIERMLNHLEMAGKLENLKGVIIGKLTKLRTSTTPPGKRSLREIIEEYFGGRNIPVIHDFPAGHCEKKVTIPLGGWVRMDTKAGYIELKGA